ncbi:MAG: UbiD family decarboxylase [Dehalococcoidia bacterium]|nr:UbiD family decarboxylase [Dehalococcoidia bacterium]
MADNIYDLRSFIERLEHEGELARVKAEVDWKYELGAIAFKCLGPPAGPALLFEKVKGYATPVFTGGLLTLKRIALALGFHPGTDEATMVKECARRLETPMKPSLVKTGPCKENKQFGKDVNVLKFPVPWWTEKDGGRYIGTWHQVMVKDPDSGWQNAGTYRMMLHDANTCGILFSPFQHISLIHHKYLKMNKPTPIAITIGNDPACELVSITPFPAGVSEWDMAGALRGRPIEVVKGETVDLLIPANAEIVIEGEIPIGERRQEGPFGEHTGFYGGGKRPMPIVRVNCVTHRNEPIFRGSILGKPVTEDHSCLSFVFASQAMAMYKAAGFPGVTGVSYPAGGDPDFNAIVAIKKSYASQGLDAGRMLLASKGGKMLKHVIVVDDDINIYDLNEILWSINTRFQASRQLYITRYESGSRLDPSVPFDWMGITDKMIMDATWPMTPDFPPREEYGGAVHPPAVKPGEEARQLVEKRWQEYGINWNK